MALFDRLMVMGLPLIPRGLLWTVARRYVAGRSLDDALRHISALKAEGFDTIIDVLGEGEVGEATARAAHADYMASLQPLADVDPRSEVSVKPTHFGLNHAEELCEELLADLCATLEPQGRKVRLEMEDAPTIDATLRVLERVRGIHANLGCVLQARLFRTEADIERLLAAFPTLDVRLVKGIYLEPASIAHTSYQAIVDNFIRLSARLLDSQAEVCLGTHDEPIFEATEAMISELGLDQVPALERRYEYQMLMGVRLPRARQLRDAGHRVRYYIPYGEDWHPYTLRRLRENPTVARHVMRALLRGE